MVVNIVQIKRNIEITNSKTRPFCNLKSNEENDKKLEVSLEDKLYLEIYYHHTLGQMQIDETPTKV